MRLGGPIFEPYSSPQEWVEAVNRSGYRAAYCPVGLGVDVSVIADYRVAAQNADIVIAEVGIWDNPLSSDTKLRLDALRHNQECLSLAEKINARCCVNISGSRGKKWDGPCADDLTNETFGMIVTNVRAIIDQVKPTHTFYTLETMPWMYPDSTSSYLRLVEEIDRPEFAVHFDPVNLVCSPQIYFNNASLVSDFVTRLGKWIRSVHLKDILLGEQLTTHLNEVLPGTGGLDYRNLLFELNKLDPDLPIMLEHLRQPDEYQMAAEYVRSIAFELNVRV